jgi:tRNA A-37 threonylcarbamoyl transferase component Bud32
MFSRRNKVYKVKIKETGMLAIMKVYSKQRELLNEYANLKKISNARLNVPRVLKKTENSLILEYIPGNLVNDLVEQLNLGNWVEELARWIAELHEIKHDEMSLIKSDSNLRNFIFSDMKIYGLDFEEMRYGDPKEDLGDICFFLLTNFPSFTNQKKVMFKRFLESYAQYSDIKLDNMEYYISKSADKAMKRRSRYLKS